MSKPMYIPRPDEEFIEVNFSGSVTMRVGGTMRVPKVLWDGKTADEEWTEDVEQYVRENVDGLRHLDESSWDGDDIEIDDVEPTAEPQP